MLYCSDDLVAADQNFTAGGRSAVNVTTYKLWHEKLHPRHLLTYADLERCEEDGIDICVFIGLLARFKLDWSNNTGKVNDWAVSLTRKGWLWCHAYLGSARDRLKEAYQLLSATIKKVASSVVSGLKHKANST